MVKTIKCECDSRCVYADEENEHYEYRWGYNIKISDGTEFYCDEYRMYRDSPDEDILVTCYMYDEDGIGSVIKEFSFTDEDTFEDNTSTYKLVVDVCKHEDYPCCGCSHEDYPMRTCDAIELCKEGRVRILGAYTPPDFYDDLY